MVGLHLVVGITLALGGRDDSELLEVSPVATVDSVRILQRQFERLDKLDATPIPTPASTAEATPSSTPIWEEETTPVQSVVQSTDPYSDCSLGPIEQLICSYDWDDATAIRVARCESGVSTLGVLDGSWASNQGNYGVFEINEVHAKGIPDFWEHWMVPEFNVAWAYGIWLGRENEGRNGWLQWGCY